MLGTLRDRGFDERRPAFRFPLFAAIMRAGHIRCWLNLAVLLFAIVPGMANDVQADSLQQRLQPLIEAHDGDVAVAVKNLKTGESFFHDADVAMPTASLIKFPVMIEAYRQAAVGDTDLACCLTLSGDDKVQGSGILTAHFSDGAQVTLRDAIRLMIAFSDNTATNLILDQIGLASVNRTMRRLGCPNTRMHAKVFRRETSVAPERSREFGLGSTTAREMIRLLRQLDEGQLVSREASDSMLQHLRACEDRTKLGRLLPSNIHLAHKTGAVSRSRADAGLFDTTSGRVAICVLTTNNADRRWEDDNQAHLLCGRLARQVFDFFNSQSTRTESDTLSSGAHGRLVEFLQRTLNARSNPSPELAIDGDFGPRTEAAVRRFQEEHGLSPTGQVDATVWQALGKLIETDEPSPAPEIVNRRSLPREPADSLSGPPFVTCDAWAIADATSGRLIWSQRAGERLDPASTTKIMTALVVLNEANRRPDLLNGTVVFSQAADRTVGSSAGIHAGERLSVRELLYGLLLPSGNDASVALAEHVGRLLGEDGDSRTPYDRFVARMNETAEDVGMFQTSFVNPHGLTAADHMTTARDLARLTSVAMRHPLFRSIVSTRQRGATVLGGPGYERHVVWKNTNRLLGIDGFDGVKTGTTQAAGACLVSLGRRNEQRLIVVVLGATSSDARYVDTHNLFRWAWRQHELAQVPEPEQRRAKIGVSQQALQLHQSALVWDGHNDLPWRIRELGTPPFSKFDIASPKTELHTDIPRLRQGGVKAQFWSVYVPVDVAAEGKALLTTLEQIQLVKSMISHYPETFGLALTATDVDRIQRAGRIASLIGVEGGHCIEDSLNVLRQLYAEGARYMTLTHSATLDWADSATGEERHGGLTPFGEEVVRGMNRLGMLVDLSHVSVATMKHALRISRAPVIFSHSSARAIADHPRNVPDDVLRLTAKNRGVVMVNFYSSFVVPESARRSVGRMAFQKQLEEQGLEGDELKQQLARWEVRHPQDRGSIHDVVDHIDHLVRVAGIDHVGLGADFDGVDSVPTQLEDVSTYPRITQELLNRGYSAEDIRKILGLNMMRVLRAAEGVAKELQ